LLGKCNFLASGYGRYTPNNDRLLRCREMSLWAISDISHCGKLPAISCQSTDARRGVHHRGEHRQAAKRAAADIEGHSTAAKHGQPGGLRARLNVRPALARNPYSTPI
jgi:hypothetical protein